MIVSWKLIYPQKTADQTLSGARIGMKTRILSAHQPEAIHTAVDILRSGGLVAFPTDTVYGLGANAFDPAAVRSLFLAKGRRDEKAVPVLIADPSDLGRVAMEASEMAAALAAHFWPGPLTIVVPKHPDLPAEISILPTVGVRIPDHPLTRALLQAAGPLAVSSANRSGGANPIRAQDVLAQLDGIIGLIIDGGMTPGGVPSTVVDCVGAEPQVLREGPISATDILRLLGAEL